MQKRISVCYTIMKILLFLLSIPKKTRLLFFCRIIIIVALVIFFILSFFSNERGKGTESSLWANRIDVVGGEKAYQEFVRNYASKPFDKQHAGAHIMGLLLYEKMGIAGLSACDPSFAFGCYHSFFGRAIAEEGTYIISKLAEECRSRYGEMGTGCEHGIGHGIMEYVGSGKLTYALELCEKTKQKNPLFGCTSGVFMEYNDPTTFEKGIAHRTRRPIHPDNLQEPCDTVPERYRTSCYFEIPLWWKNVLGKNYEKIGNLCDKAVATEEKEACFKGWGTVVAENVDYEPIRARDICTMIDNNRGALFCQLGVALRFFGTGKHEEEGKEMCNYIGEDLSAQCRQF